MRCPAAALYWDWAPETRRWLWINWAFRNDGRRPGDGLRHRSFAAGSGGGPAQAGVANHASEAPGTLKYTCGACHTTGWQTTAENGGKHQDDMPGMEGTFTEPGITCEACHGAGSVHVVTQSKADINLGDGDTECANCHYRPNRGPIEVSGGFVKHHEQSEELKNGGHGNLKCTDCHDPHKGPHYANAQPGAIRRDCYDCHQVMPNKHVSGPACEDCHMAKSTKSGIKVNAYKGDVHGHIFSLNTAAVGASDANGMFTSDGKLVDTANGKARVTLDFACYGCHTDANGVGGGGSQKTLAELSAKATGIHN